MRFSCSSTFWLFFENPDLLILEYDRLNRPHYRFCSSVRPPVLYGPLTGKRKSVRKTENGVNFLRVACSLNFFSMYCTEATNDWVRAVRHPICLVAGYLFFSRCCSVSVFGCRLLVGLALDKRKRKSAYLWLHGDKHNTIRMVLCTAAPVDSIGCG